MGNTLAMAKEAGIRIGAHPGFPDLMGFGRRNLSVSPAEAKAYVLYQLGALDAFCRVTGVKMQHVKPHGALYNMAAEDYALSTAICEAIKEFDSSLIVLALSGGQLAKAAQDMGLRTAKDIDIQADSVCVHGDGAKALAFVEKIREAFAKEGIQIRSLDEFVK